METKQKVSAFEINKAANTVGTQNGFHLTDNGHRVYSPANMPDVAAMGAIPVVQGTLADCNTATKAGHYFWEAGKSKNSPGFDDSYSVHPKGSLIVVEGYGGNVHQTAHNLDGGVQTATRNYSNGKWSLWVVKPIPMIASGEALGDCDNPPASGCYFANYSSHGWPFGVEMGVILNLEGYSYGEGWAMAQLAFSGQSNGLAHRTFNDKIFEWNDWVIIHEGRYLKDIKVESDLNPTKDNKTLYDVIVDLQTRITELENKIEEMNNAT